MHTCSRGRSKDKTTVRCKSAIGFGIRENPPFLSNEQGAASNEYIISEHPKILSSFRKFCTRISQAGLWKIVPEVNVQRAHPIVRDRPS